ncbi:hypothetical protein FA13DRAFT_100782 [Coprinellus micaceus]|uniref:Uncharacterized protein n=1 Tax=Coprinellus micaceus TaxID=71717 RepID=A0A4Y7SI18_COPMI|nr:hypothetical protein FA13DRAFT_100782 [Coprinellus micaceus]
MSPQIRAKIEGLGEDVGRQIRAILGPGDSLGQKFAKIGEKWNTLARRLPLQGFLAENVASNPGQTASGVSGPNWYPADLTLSGIFGGPRKRLRSSRSRVQATRIPLIGEATGSYGLYMWPRERGGGVRNEGTSVDWGLVMPSQQSTHHRPDAKLHHELSGE